MSKTLAFTNSFFLERKLKRTFVLPYLLTKWKQLQAYQIQSSRNPQAMRFSKPNLRKRYINHDSANLYVPQPGHGAVFEVLAGEMMIQ